MATALGYRFTDEELRRGIYHPQAHVEREAAVLIILDSLKRLLSGQTPINMNVREMPVAPEAAAAQLALLQRASNSYTDEGALRIQVVDNEAPAATKKGSQANRR